MPAPFAFPPVAANNLWRFGAVEFNILGISALEESSKIDII
jgi:hypothetical protein